MPLRRLKLMVARDEMVLLGTCSPGGAARGQARNLNHAVTLTGWGEVSEVPLRILL